MFNQSIHRMCFRSSCSQYQSRAFVQSDWLWPWQHWHIGLPCRNPTTGSQIDFLDRMRQNRCQLKFCCSRWSAWVIASYLVQRQSDAAGCYLAAKLVCFLKAGGTKRTCFTLMAYAFLNITSCTKCKSLRMYLFYISHLGPHLSCSPVQRFQRDRASLGPLLRRDKAMCVWTLIYSCAACKCAALVLSVMSFFLFLGASALWLRFISKSLPRHCSARSN